jgi:ABC-type transport system involved in multi-copper enzyme maturation permease subunit
MLAYVGVVVLVNDFRAGGIAFYLSKPIGRTHYILGKVLALGAVLAFMTLLPGLALFAAYGFFSNSPEYWLREWHLARGIVGYSLLIMIVPSLMLLALATLLRRTAPLLLVWTALFVVIPRLAEWVSDILNARGWLLANIWYDIGVLGGLSFGSLRNPIDAPIAPWAGLVVVLVCLLSVGMLLRNLRAVEVVA